MSSTSWWSDPMEALHAATAWVAAIPDRVIAGLERVELALGLLNRAMIELMLLIFLGGLLF